MKKTLRNIALAGTLAFGLAGCARGPALIVERDSQSAKGYDVLIEHSDKEYPRVIRIGDMQEGKHYFKYNSQIYAFNYGNDFTFDEIHFDTSEGSSLEELGSRKEINRIYKEVMSRQNKSNSTTK